MKIEETNNYSKFELHEFNRDPKHNTKKFRALVESMRKHGWIDAYPMHCVRNGSNKLKIKAGHNRFDAAQMLGIPVKYIVCEDKSSLNELENSHNQWGVFDHLCGYSRQGISDYRKLKDFYTKYNIPICVSATLLAGKAATESGWHMDKFKKGEFKVGNPTHAYNVGDMVSFCEDLGIAFCRNSRFVMALSRVLLVDGVEIEELKKKIKNHIYFMEKQPDMAGYVRMLERVYNRQRGPKLAIAINAL